jgi:hypothetical protein
MSTRRLLQIAIAVAAIWIGLFIVGYWIFSSDDGGPPVEVVTTP